MNDSTPYQDRLSQWRLQQLQQGQQRLQQAKPQKKRRIFLWFFLALQVVFIIWLIAAGHTGTAPTHADLANVCYGGKWYPLFKSQADCVAHGGYALQQAGDVGKSLGIVAIIGTWVALDVILGIIYGVYRLARS
jgi:hypothetical protein